MRSFLMKEFLLLSYPLFVRVSLQVGFHKGPIPRHFTPGNAGPLPTGMLRSPPGAGRVTGGSAPSSASAPANKACPFCSALAV